MIPAAHFQAGKPVNLLCLFTHSHLTWIYMSIEGPAGIQTVLPLVSGIDSERKHCPHTRGGSAIPSGWVAPPFVNVIESESLLSAELSRLVPWMTE
jgi:hypothetical protein